MLPCATGAYAELETEPVVGGAADAEGPKHDAAANSEAEDASTHVEDVAMGKEDANGRTRAGARRGG